MTQLDAFATVAGPDPSSPWRAGSYEPDLVRLRGLISTCFEEGSWRARQSGDLGPALDLWIADELRWAGYEPDAVWPRAEDPRVLPAALARTIRRLRPAQLSSSAAKKIADGSGSARATVQGEFFAKAVDVLVADWDRGVELMVSTKAMVSSFGKNVTNRWEEFVGDLRNIRGRFPLAVLGVVFLADASIMADEPNAFERLLDMLRKLRLQTSPDKSYDATMLLLAAPDGLHNARLMMEDVPADLAPSQFFEALLARTFERLPVAERQTARALHDQALVPETEPGQGLANQPI